MTYETNKDGHHVGPDGRHVKCDIFKIVVPLHMHVVVLISKFDDRYILLSLLPLLQQVQILQIQYVMIPKRPFGGAAQQATLALVVDGPETTNNWKKSRQCPWRHLARCSLCLVTFRSRCVE